MSAKHSIGMHEVCTALTAVAGINMDETAAISVHERRLPINKACITSRYAKKYANVSISSKKVF
jgi:hypothetical protein